MHLSEVMGEGKLKDKIKQRDYKLQSLLEITKAINANLSVEDLVQQYRNTLSDQLHIPQILLFIFDENPTCWIQHGFSELAQWETHVNQLHRSATIKIQTIELDQSHVVVIPIEKDGVPIAFVILGDGDEELIEMSPSLKHMRFVQTLTGVLVVAIQNKTLIEQTIAQAAIKRELQLAAEMQNLLLPKNLPQSQHLKVDAFYNAHGQVGGDYYDFFLTPNNGWMACIADVSGKGISAAFLMASVQAHVQSFINSQGYHLKELVNQLNDVINKNANGEKFVTFFIAQFHPEENKIEYINCGHNPALFFHHEIKNHIWLHAQIPGLGMIETLPQFESKWIDFNQNSELLCYTDGLVEIENPRQEAFGEERVLAVLNSKATGNTSDNLINAVESFRDGMPYIDDIAILSIQM